MKTILSAAVTLSLLILSIGSMKADPLDNWTFSRMPTNSPGSLQLFSIAYGYGRYVGVGEYFGDDNGFIETSEDGTNWTMRSQHDFSILDLFDVTFGNGMFVAVGWNFFGGRNIYSSTNGVDWSPHTTAMANVVAVSYGEGMYVAVGDGNNLNSSTISSNNVYYSFDGTTWMATDSGFPASATQTLKDVAYGNGRFIAVDQAHHIYSLFESIITNNLAGSMVSFCNDRFFIPAGPGTNLVSMNGLSWSALTNNTGSSFRHVVYLKIGRAHV